MAFHPTLKRLTRATALTYLRSFVTLVAAVGLPLVPAVLITQIDRVRETTDSVYVNGQLVTFVEPMGTALEWGLNALWIAGVLLGLVAGVLLAGAALLGHPIGVRQAWRRALPRTPAVAVLLAIVGVAMTLVVWAYAEAIADSGEESLPVLALFLSSAVVPALVPVLIALPVAVLERVGPFRAIRRAHEISFHRWRVQAGGSLGALLVGGGAGWTAWSLFERGGDLTVESPVTTGLGVLLLVATAPLVLVTLCAPVAFSGRFTAPAHDAHANPEAYRKPSQDPSQYTYLPSANGPRGGIRLLELDLVRVHAGLPEAAVPGTKAGVIAAPALLAVLLVPPLIGPVTVAGNPDDAPRTASVPVEDEPGSSTMFRAEERVDAALHGDGMAITLTDRWSLAVVCDPECTEEAVSPQDERVLLSEGHGSSLDENGELVYTSWRKFMHQEEDMHSEAPHEASGLYVGVCEDPLDCTEMDGGELIRPYTGSRIGSYSSVSPVEDGLVVSSFTREREDDGDLPGEESDFGGLRMQVCADDGCENPVDVDLPEEIGLDHDLRDFYFDEARPEVDVAGAPGGGFTATIVDRVFGAVWVVGCEETECSSPEVTQVVDDQFSRPNDHAPAERVGARVEYRSDGTPVVAHRHADGSARVLDCADPACAEAEENQVAEAVWTRPLPGFDLDSQERPQLLTPDYDSGRLLLVSCLDTGCSDTTETLLSPFEDVPLHTALAMDDHDRPHLLSVGSDLPSAHADSAYGGSGEYVRCSEPWCGADPG